MKSPAAPSWGLRPVTCQVRLKTVWRSSSAILGSTYHAAEMVDASSSGAAALYDPTISPSFCSRMALPRSKVEQYTQKRTGASRHLEQSSSHLGCRLRNA